jgi:hypothetical protein
MDMEKERLKRNHDEIERVVYVDSNLIGLIVGTSGN